MHLWRQVESIGECYCTWKSPKALGIGWWLKDEGFCATKCQITDTGALSPIHRHRQTKFACYIAPMCLYFVYLGMCVGWVEWGIEIGLQNGSYFYFKWRVKSINKVLIYWIQFYLARFDPNCYWLSFSEMANAIRLYYFNFVWMHLAFLLKKYSSHKIQSQREI